MDKALKIVLSNIGKQSNMEKPKITRTYQTRKGDGYMGTVQMYDITDEVEINGRRLSVVVKQSPSDPGMHANLPVAIFYETEISFYTKIVPALNDLQSDYGIKCFNFAKCFHTANEPLKEMLILENLIPKNYIMLDRAIPMKVDHMKVAFEELARLHALSFALKALKPKMYKEIMAPFYRNNLRNTYLSSGYEYLLEKVTHDFKEQLIGTKYYHIFSDFSERIMDHFAKCNSIGDYAVLCHGDAWSNNILFSHDSSGNPTSAIYVDYQMCRIQSSVVDLSYLFYGCAHPDLISKLNDFLGFYHNTLKETLEMFGLDIELIYTWGRLLEDWRNHGKLGFITSFLMRVMMLSTLDETPDIPESVNTEKVKIPPMVAAYYYKMKRQEEYDNTLLAIIKHFIDEKCIY